MSTLALRNYGLVMPNNYVSIDSTEMEYIDGGGTFSSTYRNLDGIYDLLWGLGGGVAKIVGAIQVAIVGGAAIVPAIIAAGSLLWGPWEALFNLAAVITVAEYYVKYGKYTIKETKVFGVTLMRWVER